MSQAPLELRDDDFECEPPPPGYLSQKHKDRYLPLMIVVAFVMFVAQMAVPIIVMMVTPGAPSISPFQQEQKHFGRFTVWQDALWHPTMNIFPAGAGRTRLVAMDLETNPLDRPPISIEMQPDWLIADGEKLWAVSDNEVSEVFGDGSTPFVVRPDRFLLHPSKPFLHDGRLMVFDRDEDEPYHLFAFFNGEWIDQGEVALPADAYGDSDSDFDSDDAPADALEVGNEEVVTPDSADTTPYATFPTPATDEPSLHLAAVSTAQGLAVFVESKRQLHFRMGVPLAQDGVTPQWSDWETVGTGLEGQLSATIVDGQPAVAQNDERNWSVWRKSGTGWSVLPVDKAISSSGLITGLGVATVPDSGRTLMIVEELDGMFGSPLLELKADGVTQVAKIGSPFSFGGNPFLDATLAWQLPMQIATYVVLILQVLLFHWLIQTHRDPNYYKGTTAVEYASVLRRVIAATIDTTIVYGPIGVMVWLLMPQLGDPLGMIKQLETNPAQFLLDLLKPLAYLTAWVLGVGFVMWLMLSFGGFSPGKLVCGVRVATTNLKQPGLLRGLVRSIIWPFESLFIFSGLGALTLIAFTPHRQRLADLVGGLIVVKAGSLRKARQAAHL